MRGPIIALSAGAWANEAAQTDWSGGPGIPGPVTQWQDRFASSQALDWAALPGGLVLLAAMPIGHPATTFFAEPAGVAAADIDEDTHLDIISVAFAGHDVAWFENDGTGGGWTKHLIAEGFEGVVSVSAFDLDGDDDIDRDTHPDEVGAAFYANDICWWENVGGASSWIRHDVDLNFPRPINVRTGDIDDDTDPDILGASYMGEIAWWENDGAGSGWLKHQVASGLATPFSCRLADLDGDADLDVIGNDGDGNRVKWWANVDGLGTRWLEHLVDSTSSGPNDVLAADMDGDEHPEVIGSLSWDHSILWYEPVSDVAASGALGSSILNAGRSEVNWGTIDWSCTTPPNTSVMVEVRASSDPGDMGSWSAVASSGEDLSAYVSDGDAYFQYRVSLGTTDSTIAPSFDHIQVGWDHISGVDADAYETGWFLASAATPTPSVSGSAAIRFTVPYACEIDLSLYDAQGRRITTIAQGHHTAGDHVATVSGLGGGVNYYRLSAERIARAGSLVVR